MELRTYSPRELSDEDRADGITVLCSPCWDSHSSDGVVYGIYPQHQCSMCKEVHMGYGARAMEEQK